MHSSTTFGEYYLAPMLAEFASLNPRIQLDLSFDDRSVDLIAEGFDLALRIGNLPDSGLIARRLAKIRAAVLASPRAVQLLNFCVEATSR